MKLRLLSAAFAVLAFTAVAVAQDPGSAPNSGSAQAPGQNPNQNSGQGNGGGYGQRGGRGGMGGGMMGRGLMGTVTEVGADHYTIKTEMGDVYTVHFSAETHITKQPAGMRGPGGGGGGEGNGGGGGYGRGGNGGGGNPPQEIKATDIKVGDAIVAGGDIDATAKSVGATRVMQLDPDTAKRMQEQAASFGKTWLGGKVTAINGTTITLTGALDNAPHTVAADENTTFRRRRDPITLADIQVGDTVRAEGAVKDGVFTATAVSIGGGMGGPPPNGPAGAPSGSPSGPAPGPPPQ
ncbi:MAG TPA: DUF5666 domain-containing protein [Candidatus Cybelea sp.]|nr:DUF5666 domain-containing protein [Candidatus Cybelea sp.]